jgi:hypothetical protein
MLASKGTENRNKGTDYACGVGGRRMLASKGTENRNKGTDFLPAASGERRMLVGFKSRWTMLRLCCTVKSVGVAELTERKA